MTTGIQNTVNVRLVADNTVVDSLKVAAGTPRVVGDVQGGVDGAGQRVGVYNT